jgi:hypothetical protein
MRKHVYIQFQMHGVGSQGMPMSTEPLRWRSALMGKLDIPEYDVSGFRDRIWATDVSTSDPRSLNLEVDGGENLDELKRCFTGALLIGEFILTDNMPPLTKVPRTARVIRDVRFNQAPLAAVG